MQKKQSRFSLQFKVGTFILLSLALSVIVIFLLGVEKAAFDKTYALWSRFDNISGLRVGASIHLAGIKAGVVDKIELDEQSQDVRVKLKINEKFKERIREDSRVSIRTQGLLGDKMIFITVGSPKEKMLEPNSEIKTKNQSMLAGMLGEEGEAVFNQLATTMNKVEGLLDSATKTSDEVFSLVHDIRTKPSLANDLLFNPESKKISRNLSQLLGRLNRISNHLNQITGKVNKGTGTLGALVNDPSVFYDLQTLLGKANRNKLIKTVIRMTLKTREKKAIHD